MNVTIEQPQDGAISETEQAVIVAALGGTLQNDHASETEPVDRQPHWKTEQWRFTGRVDTVGRGGSLRTDGAPASAWAAASRASYL